MFSVIDNGQKTGIAIPSSLQSKAGKCFAFGIWGKYDTRPFGCKEQLAAFLSCINLTADELISPDDDRARLKAISEKFNRSVGPQ